MKKSLFTFSVCCIFFFALLHQANAGPTDPVDIPDDNLRAVIETKLSKSSGDTITESEMNGMAGKLDANNKSISNLTGLEHATGITILELADNSIANITPLKNLTALEKANS